MTGKVLTSDWLATTNIKLAAEGVPVENRYRQARALWYEELLPDRLACGDSELQYNQLQIAQEQSFANIESFFLTHNQKRLATGMLGGPIYRGAFYYLGDFWPFLVPLILGGPRTVRFLKYLDAPQEVLAMLRQDEFGITEFSRFGEDCFDYGYAIDEIMSRGLPITSNRFLISADAHLSATSQILFMGARDTKPLLDAAMSIEIFCKAFLAATKSNTETQLRKYRHNVSALMDSCIDSGLSELSLVKGLVESLPKVDGRYRTTECIFGEVWQAYRTALFVGVTILRNLSGRDCRKPITSR